MEEMKPQPLHSFLKSLMQLIFPLLLLGGLEMGRHCGSDGARGAGAQLGTRFLMSQESSAHQNFKTLLQNSARRHHFNVEATCPCQVD